MSQISVLIIAAGSSSRLGQPKQLLKTAFGKTFIEHTIDSVRDTQLSDVWVVLGANHDQIAPLLDENIKRVINTRWKEGMGLSISLGVSEIIRTNPERSAILVLLCDQPYISSEVIQRLIREYAVSNKGIAFSRYGDGRFGPPAVFSHKYFAQLMTLEGDVGAKKIILANQEDTTAIEFENGSKDIDTWEQYEQYLEDLH